MDTDLLWLVSLFFATALLYSSVGHGGASAYLALFALFGFARVGIVPTALALNLLVSGLAFFHYYRAGHFDRRLFVPFALTSIPAAYVGGLLHLSQTVFSILLGIALCAAAARLLVVARPMTATGVLTPRRLYGIGLPVGLVLGFIAGMLGIGGGIFLSPLLLALGWAAAKKTAAVSAAFIFVNSCAGLLAQTAHAPLDWTLTGMLAVAVLLGGSLGAHVGAVRLRPLVLQRVLALVLLLAGFKLLKTALLQGPL